MSPTIRDAGQADLLAWSPPTPVRAFDPARVRAITLAGKIKRAIAEALRHAADDGVARYLVSAATAAPTGAELIRPAMTNGAFAPGDIVAALFARGLRRLLIEGGARTISLVIDAGQIDRLHLLVAPVIIGSGKTGLDLAPIASLSSALRPRVDAFSLGDGEILFDCDLRSRGATER